VRRPQAWATYGLRPTDSHGKERINAVVVLRPDDKTIVKPTAGPRLTCTRLSDPPMCSDARLRRHDT